MKSMKEVAGVKWELSVLGDGDELIGGRVFRSAPTDFDMALALVRFNYPRRDEHRKTRVVVVRTETTVEQVCVPSAELVSRAAAFEERRRGAGATENQLRSEHKARQSTTAHRPNDPLGPWSDWHEKGCRECEADGERRVAPQLSSASEVGDRPGSREAASKGCKCDPVVNRDGKGAGRFLATPTYHIADDCPLHVGAPWVSVRRRS